MLNCPYVYLYSIDIGQQAIRSLALAMRDVTGNMPSLPRVFLDYFARPSRSRAAACERYNHGPGRPVASRGGA
jgi:hypothetical protein